MGYNAFEIDVIGYEGEISPFSFNIDNINYYRPFIETKESGKDNVSTLVFFSGSVKSIKVNCSYSEFKAKIENAIKNI